MTAPAEDPRGGEVCKCGHGFEKHLGYVGVPMRDSCAGGTPGFCGCTGFQRPPAAGRGDTASSGETWRPVCGCEQGMGHMDRGCHSYGLCHAQSAERAARPAGDRAQPTEELREAIRDEIAAAIVASRQTAWEDLHVPPVAWGETYADRLLAGPLAALLDAQAAVERVEALCEDGGHEGWVSTRQIESALGGTA